MCRDGSRGLDRRHQLPVSFPVTIDLQAHANMRTSEWGRDSRQIFGPGDAPYTLQAVYRFTVNGTTATGGETLSTPHLAKRSSPLGPQRPSKGREL